MKTREDFIVEETEGTYGPIWIVSPKEQKGGYYEDIHYVLRADWKMEFPAGCEHEKSVHLDVTYGDDPLKSHGGWKGVYTTEDMYDAVNSLIEDLNRNEELEEIERAIEEPAAQLSEELSSIYDAVKNFAHTDIQQVMDNIEVAYLSLRMKYEEALNRVNP